MLKVNDSAASPDLTPLKKWQIQRLHALLPWTVTSGAVMAMVSAAVLAHETMPAWRLLPWLATLAVVALLQLLLYRQYQATAAEPVQHQWYQRLWASVLITAALWGCGAIAYFPADDLAQQQMLAAIYLGLSLAVLAGLAPVWRLLVVFQALSLLPLIGMLAREGQSAAHLMASLLLTCMALGLAGARRLQPARERLGLGGTSEARTGQEATAESELRFHALVENIGDALFVHDRQGRLLNVNSQACDSLGYTREELLARTVFDIDPDVQPEKLLQAWRDFAGGERLRVQSTHRRKDGSVFPVDIHLGVFLQDGEPLLLAVARDMSVFQEQADQLRSHREKLRAQYLAIPIPTYTFQYRDGEFLLVDANTAAVEYTDGGIQQRMGVSASEILEGNLPILELMRQCYERRQAVAREISYAVPNRGQRSLAVKFAFVPPDTVMVHAEDITEQKRSEQLRLLTQERFKEAERIAHLGYWALDAKTRVLQWSDELYNILGVDRGVERPDLEMFLALLHPADRPLMERNMEMLFRTGEVPDMEFRILRQDGSPRTLASASKMLRDSEGEISYFGVVQDISDGKLQQQMLIDAKEEAERANRTKSEFLSSMSHELRTPMNAILGFTQLLQLDSSLTAKHKQAIEEIHRAGNHLLELINDVLDLSQIESQRLELLIEEISLASIIDETETLIAPIANRRQIKLQRADLNFNDEPVLADRTRVRQVLLNLLSNAVKYNRQQGTITISCKVVDGERVRVSVIDTGYGMDEQKLRALFVPFQRMGAEKTDVEGTGIGLVIARKLVELMGGSIAVTSVPGQGSTFSFELPIGLGSEELREARQPELANLPGQLLRKRQVRILYVEDNPANLRLVENILSQYEGVEMFSAPEPQLGLELALAHLPDVILLDINLPGMDGYRVMKKLREHGSTTSIPVVAISANAMPRDVERGRQAGFYEYLTKPINVMNLMTVLEDAIGGAVPRWRSDRESASSLLQ